MALEVVLRGPGGETIKFNPARDISNFWPVIIAETVMYVCRPEVWDNNMKKLLKDAGHSYPPPATVIRSLTQTLLGICQILERASRPEITSPKDAITNTFFEVSDSFCQTLSLYALGVISLGTIFGTLKGTIRAETIPEFLTVLGEKVRQYIEELSKEVGETDVQQSNTPLV